MHAFIRASQSRHPGCQTQISIISTGLPGCPSSLGFVITIYFQSIGQPLLLLSLLSTPPHLRNDFRACRRSLLPILFQYIGDCLRLTNESTAASPTANGGTRSTDIKAYKE